MNDLNAYGTGVADNKRIGKRHNLNYPIEFSSGRGISHDISSTGIYFLTQELLWANEEIKMTIFTSQHSPIQCEGKVIRVDRNAENNGIAVKFANFMAELAQPRQSLPI